MIGDALGSALEAHLARGRELREEGASQEDYTAWRVEAMELVASIPGTRPLLEALRRVQLPEHFQAAEALLLSAMERAKRPAAPAEVSLEVGDEEETCPLVPVAPSEGASLVRAWQLLPHLASSPEEEAELRQTLLALTQELEALDADWGVLRPALIRILSAGEALFLAVLPYLAQRFKGTG